MKHAVHYSSDRQDWGTPQRFINYLEDWQQIELDLDVCASAENHKAPKYFTIEDDALEQDWVCENGWMNPPFGQALPKFISKAIVEVMEERAKNMWILVPARTDTKWFHELVVPHASTIWFIKGRFNFRFDEATPGANAPFPSMLIHMDKYSILSQFIVKTHYQNVPKEWRGYY